MASQPSYVSFLARESAGLFEFLVLPSVLTAPGNLRVSPLRAGDEAAGAPVEMTTLW